MTSQSETDRPILSLQGIKKHFGGVKALDGVDLDLYPGEVVALIGENGAGKSTAVKIMTGIYRPDAGRIFVAGEEVEVHDTRDAWRHGITAVHQETVMFEDLSVAENIFMGHLERRAGGFLDWKGMRRRAAEILRELESDIDADAAMNTLSVAQKHMVEIARALSHDSRVMILDEPTAALSQAEIHELYGIIRRWQAQGKAILYISHKFDEIFAIADRWTCFRDGAWVGQGRIADVTEDDLVRLMVGRSVAQLFPKPEVTIGEAVLEISGLGNAREFDGISFTLHKGEVLGFYGLVGAGRTEVMEAIFGLKPIDRGEMRMNGKPMPHGSPREVIDQGIVYVPEDRQHAGVILPMSIRDNLTLPLTRALAKNGVFLNDRAEQAVGNRFRERLSIKCASLDQKVSELSGGNQQKVVIGKWLATHPGVIILDEPTKGIDVGSKSAVHAFIAELVRDGLSVIMVSSELPELMGMSDRIIVMHQGHTVRELARADFDAETIVAAATGLGRLQEKRHA
ncbi:sugar ABC transporter ATP-binding protein [Siculibacillus lacustris]|uniref:Sugar ABC transporter ATP-binding protein n=1 Tax=Siculibacillus lacustris TaxID=1549641 RepID=A0A4Q9VY95_9HYPH|nr:sugar ABC transporter ATP-binding protein [Siculibacillus lacustris]TBW41380.1 sugar ABC transporter ATP-binding protein [Siculibacillus lacustris]